jgi:uncharacterized protein
MGAVQTQAAVSSPARPHVNDWKHVLKKKAVTWARWLHIYLSMVSFAILFFFAATGLTLTHQDWFANQQRTVVHKGTVNSAWVGKDVAKLEIVEQLRRAHGIKAEMGELRVDDGQISVGFKGPGYTADTVIDRATGEYEVTETRMGWGAVINDLHKGRDTGKVWGIVIDASAIFMTVVSGTGLALIFFMTKRRRSGLIILIAGAAVCCTLYLAFVP